MFRWGGERSPGGASREGRWTGPEQQIRDVRKRCPWHPTAPCTLRHVLGGADTLRARPLGQQHLDKSA
eukprot:15459056-Alexandrium_andersonii.AAC.1